MTLDPVSSGDPHVPAHNSERDAINALQEQMATKISLPPGAATGDLLRWDGTGWFTTETRFFEGHGAPNGAFAAPVGSRYIDMDATNGVVEWVKRTGGESNTGWISLVGDSGWLEIGTSGNPSFQNGWINLGGGLAATAAFRRFNNVVYLKGVISRVTSRAFTAFNLPAGFRPHADYYVSVWANGTTTNDTAAVNINKNGDVKGRAATAGSLSLDGISFPADN